MQNVVLPHFPSLAFMHPMSQPLETMSCFLNSSCLACAANVPTLLLCGKVFFPLSLVLLVVTS